MLSEIECRHNMPVKRCHYNLFSYTLFSDWNQKFSQIPWLISSSLFSLLLVSRPRNFNCCICLLAPIGAHNAMICYATDSLSKKHRCKVGVVTNFSLSRNAEEHDRVPAVSKGSNTDCQELIIRMI